MIGTHDSFTYLKAKNKIYELFSFLWRTQTKSIKGQKELGVKYLDVRVHKTKGNQWELCHGLINFNKQYNTLYNLMEDLSDFKIRLILEKGTKADEEVFKFIIYKLSYKYSNLVFSAIKKNWKVLHNTLLSIIDYTYIPFYSNLSFWQNIKRMNWFSTIKKWAKRHNPIITQKMREDNDVVYFIDLI